MAKAKKAQPADELRAREAALTTDRAKLVTEFDKLQRDIANQLADGGDVEKLQARRCEIPGQLDSIDAALGVVRERIVEAERVEHGAKADAARKVLKGLAAEGLKGLERLVAAHNEYLSAIQDLRGKEREHARVFSVDFAPNYRKEQGIDPKARPLCADDHLPTDAIWPLGGGAHSSIWLQVETTLFVIDDHIPGGREQYLSRLMPAGLLPDWTNFTKEKDHAT